MKRISLLIIFFLAVLPQCIATRYFLYSVTNNLNLRNSPFIDSEIICVMPVGSYVVITDFENVKFDSGLSCALYVDENIEGWASTKYMKFIQELSVDENGVFTKIGESYEINPQLYITNKTTRSITVTINGTVFSFEPGTKQRIECEPGSVSVIASSPGIIPYIGKDYLEGNSKYSWDFVIKTTYNNHIRYHSKRNKRK